MTRGSPANAATWKGAASAFSRPPAWFGRMLHSPRFALTVILILGLGIGINVATLGLLYRYYVSPLPWPSGERIVDVYFTANQSIPRAMSVPTWQRLKKGVPALADSGLYREQGYNVQRGSRTSRLNGIEATASVFSTLGVQPVLGRLFGPESDRPGAKPVVVLSYRLWQQLFDGKASALGQTFKLNGKLFTVVGVMPKNFNFPTEQTAMWTPRVIAPGEQDADMLTAFNEHMIGRLAADSTIAEFDTQANVVLKNEIANFPDPTAIPLFEKYDFGIHAESWRESRLGNLHQSLVLVQFATALLMLLVWFNLANLSLARAFGRRSEFAMRRILGAGIRTLVWSLARENLLLSLGGAALGIAFGRFLLGLFAGSSAAAAASSIPGTSWPVLVLLGIGLAFISATIFTLSGFIFLRGNNLAATLGEGNNRASPGPVARRIRTGLLVSQIALACALAGCGLFLARSLLNLNAVDLGFKPDRLVTFKLNFPEAQYPLAKMTAALGELRSAIARSPGMDAASVSSEVPFDGDTGGNNVFPRPANPDVHPEVFPVATDAAYFRTFGMPLLAGRNFTPADVNGGTSLAVIDALAAERLFGTDNAVGREFSFDSAHSDRFGLLFRVIGVVPTARRANLGAAPDMGTVYIDYPQVVDRYSTWSWGFRDWYLTVRSPLPTDAVISQVKRTAGRIIPGVPLYDVQTMNQRLGGSLASQRILTVLVGLFAFGALLLAAIGLYAVQAYAVAQRAREFAIRAAIGADRGRLFALVLGETAWLLVLGLVLGLAGLAGIGLAFASAFYGIGTVDPVSMALVTIVLAGVSLAAGWLPAWRASRVAPGKALSG